MSRSRFFRVFAVLLVLLMPFCFFIYFEMNKKEAPKQLVVYESVPYYKFVNQFGDTITSDDMKGYVYVTDFISTTDSAESRKLSAILSGIQESYKTDYKVRLISFSLDPESDSVTALNQYAAKYKAMPNKWFFLRGDEQSIVALAEKGFKVPLIKAKDRNGFAYASQLTIVDGDGKVRGYYDVVKDVEQIDSVYSSMERLLTNKPE